MNQRLKISSACFTALLAVVVNSGHAAPPGQYLPFTFRLQDKRSVAGSDAVLQQRLQQQQQHQPTGFGGFGLSAASTQFGLGHSAYYPGVLPLPFAGFDGFGGVPSASPYDFGRGFAAFDSPAYPAFHQFGAAPATGYPFAAPVQLMMVHHQQQPKTVLTVPADAAAAAAAAPASAVQPAESSRYPATSQPEQRRPEQQQYPPQLDQQLEQLLQQYPSLRSLRLPTQTATESDPPVQSVPDLYLDLKPPPYSAQSANLPSYAATSAAGSPDLHPSTGNAAAAAVTRHPSGTGTVDYESVASVSYTLPAEYDNASPQPSAPRGRPANNNVIVVSNALYGGGGGESDNYAPEGLSPADQARGLLRPAYSNSLSANSYDDSNSIIQTDGTFSGRVAPKVPATATGTSDPKEYFSAASNKATASAADYDKRVRYSQAPISSVTVSRNQR